MNFIEFITQGWEAPVYLLVTLWAGYSLGQLSAHFWHYNHYKETLKRRIYGPSDNYARTQKKLADQAENRLEMLDRQAAETDAKLFSAALVAGFAYYLRQYFLDW